MVLALLASMFLISMCTELHSLFSDFDISLDLYDSRVIVFPDNSLVSEFLSLHHFDLTLRHKMMESGYWILARE